MTRFADPPYKDRLKTLKKYIGLFYEKKWELLLLINNVKAKRCYGEFENKEFVESFEAYCAFPYNICKLFIRYFGYILVDNYTSANESSETKLSEDKLKEILDNIKVFRSHDPLTELFNCEHNRKILTDFFCKYDLTEDEKNKNKEYLYLHHLDKSKIRTCDVHEKLEITLSQSKNNVESIFHKKYDIIFDRDTHNKRKNNIHDIEKFVEGLSNDITLLYNEFLNTLQKFIFNESGFLVGNSLDSDGTITKFVIPIRVHEIKLRQKKIYQKKRNFLFHVTNGNEYKDTKVTFTKPEDLKEKFIFFPDLGNYYSEYFGGVCGYYYDHMIKGHQDSVKCLELCQINFNNIIEYSLKGVKRILKDKEYSYTKIYTKEFAQKMYQYMKLGYKDRIIEEGLCYEYENKMYSKVEYQLEQMAKTNPTKFTEIIEFLRKIYTSFDANVKKLRI
jgi:hypothetical protein